MKLLLLLLMASNVWAGDVSLTVAGLRKAANLAKFKRFVRDAAAGRNLRHSPDVVHPIQ